MGQTPNSLESLLKKVIKDLGKPSRLTEEDIVGYWTEVAGHAASKHTKPISIKRAVLTVNVDGSPWLYELSTRKREMLAGLQGKIKTKKLKDIRFRIGAVR